METATLVMPVMSDELIKSILATATERPNGLALCVTNTCGRDTGGTVTIRSSKPSIVRQMGDGRIGFHVEGISYITGDNTSGGRFMAWLQRANNNAVKQQDYGQPTNCFFHRCC